MQANLSRLNLSTSSNTFLYNSYTFYIIPRLLKIGYIDAVVIAFISSSTQFEVAIATATVVFGIDSGVALAMVVGPLWEVSSMLLFVKLIPKTRHYFFHGKTLANP